MTTGADLAGPAGPVVGGVVLDVGDPGLEAAVRKGLAAVEDGLHGAVGSDHPFVDEAARYLVAAGGKRFRPLVVLLAAQFGRPDADLEGLVVPAAVAIELTHLSTLYHDDVMDEAVVRRGAPSANARWGNTVAILTGDFLFARASEITADLGTEATRILARTIAVLCQGQIRETVGPQPGQDPADHWLETVAEKTGSLIATSARLGALLSGADADTVELLTRYGDIIGVGFQLSDDLLDLAGRRTESGKRPGTDLREGVLTLPVLLALRHADLPSTRRLQELVDRSAGGGGLDDDEVAEALALLADHPGLADARGRLEDYADEARRVVAPLPPGPARRALELLVDVVVARTG